MSASFRQLMGRTKHLLVLKLLALVILNVTVRSYAQTPTAAPTNETLQEKSFAGQDGKIYRYQLNYFLNNNGEKELVVSLIEAHWLTNDTHLEVLRGRDTNADQIIDVWFYSTGAVVKSLARKAHSEDAWLTAKDILLEFSLNEARWLATLVGKEILSTLFQTVQGEIQNSKELELLQMDLLDLDYRIEALSSSQSDPFLLHELKRVSAEGWKKLIERVNRGQITERQERAMGDVALFVGNAALLRGAKFLAGRALSSPTLNSMKSHIRAVIQEQEIWKQQIAKKATSLGSPNKLTLAGLASGAGIFSSAASTSLVRFASAQEAIGWMSRQTFFSRTLQKIATMIKEVAVASWDRRGYVATTQTMQLAVESYARGYWTFADVPLVLDHPVQSTQEFIQQVSNDKGLLQNFSYMTLQTSLLSGASEALARRNAKLGTKYAVCSMITLLDSATVNVLVQGRSDVSRIAFDTAWEVFIGGSQVQLDLMMLRWANGLAEKFKNPKLKLVGYLLGSLDQGIGYTLYNKASSTYFEGKPTEHANKGDSKSNASSSPSGVAPVVIVPVLAP